jgi:predicted house-cleaning noncanonical NTP pyrophosphatase (MazG superfamily)
MSKIIKYNKLIRDRIPEIIEEAGKEYKIRELNDEEYLAKLKEKLQEEVDEYLESNKIEELADILEVIRALAITHREDIDSLETIRKKKQDSRGGFSNRLLLIEAEE